MQIRRFPWFDMSTPRIVAIMTSLRHNMLEIPIDDSERKVLNTGSTGPVRISRLFCLKSERGIAPAR